MPLPPALAAKLAKRGIINVPKDPEPETATTAEEEIIAEDYDDTPQQTSLIYTPAEPQVIDPFLGYHGCPNKWNVYHECNNMCREQWKERVAINPEYERRRTKMLSKYPLPNHWQEVLDPGIGRHYYWNTETDLVSWLPPGHPRCQVSRSSATLRKEMATELGKHRQVASENDIEMTNVEEEDEDKDDVDHMSDKSEESGDETIQREKRDQERRNRTKDKGRERGGKDRRGRRLPAKEELDPMDPASYGECGKGTWASGLPQRNEARTGADVTASGPLFQMRPYPSPGAVLRANAAATTQIGPKKT